MISCIYSIILDTNSEFNIRFPKPFALCIPPFHRQTNNTPSFWRSKARRGRRKMERMRGKRVEGWRGVLKREMVIDGRGKMWWNSETERAKKKKPWRERGDDEEMWGVEVKLNPGWKVVEWSREARGRSLLQQFCDYTKINNSIFLSLCSGFILSSVILKHPPPSFFVAFHSLLWFPPYSLTYFQCIIQVKIPERRAWPLKKHEGSGPAAVSCHLWTGPPSARVARTRKGAR